MADAAVVTAALRPNPVVTVSLMRPDQSLVDAGISPYEQVFRTDYVVERGGKRERRVDQATLAKSVVELQLLNTTRTLMLDVESAFTDVQLAQAQSRAGQDNLRRSTTSSRSTPSGCGPAICRRSSCRGRRLAALQFQNDVRQQETKLRWRAIG